MVNAYKLQFVHPVFSSKTKQQKLLGPFQKCFLYSKFMGWVDKFNENANNLQIQFGEGNWEFTPITFGINVSF